MTKKIKSEVYKQIKDGLVPVIQYAAENGETLIAQNLLRTIRELNSLISWAEGLEKKT